MSITAVSGTLPDKYIKVGRTRALSPEFLRVCESYLDEGYGYKNTAHMLGVSLSVLKQRFPGKGLSAREVLELAWASRSHQRKMQKVTYAKPVVG